jgi:hypothetical protein
VWQPFARHVKTLLAKVEKGANTRLFQIFEQFPHFSLSPSPVNTYLILFGIFLLLRGLLGLGQIITSLSIRQA